MTVRLVVADDHEIFREGLVMVLGNASGIEVIADVAGGDAAIEAVRDLAPDIAIVDVAMPGVNGIEVAAHVHSEMPAVRTICLSMHADRDIVGRALAAGASGYVLKGCGSAELIEAVRCVASGQSYLCTGVTDGVIRDAVGRDTVSRSNPALTERERGVLQLISEGHGSADIARRLSISQKTVGTHREHIMAKLDLHSVATLTKYAIRHGYTSAE